jgi:hypothetical protein
LNSFQGEGGMKLKNLKLMGAVLALIMLTISLNVASAEKEKMTVAANTTMQDNMTVLNNMSVPMFMHMNKAMPIGEIMSMPIDKSTNTPMNKIEMPSEAITTVVVVQNVTLNIITTMNMTFPNAFQLPNSSGY